MNIDQILCYCFYRAFSNESEKITYGSFIILEYFYEEISFYEDRFMYADQELFEIFTIPFIQGNPDEALTRPQTLVISNRIAQKYFAHVNPLGKTLEINQKEYEITGVVVNPPENTHLKYDLIACFRVWD